MDCFVKVYNKIANGIEKLCSALGGITVFLFVVIITVQVFARNVFKVPMIWANDFSLICFVWATFFGSAIAVRHRSHYVVELIPDKFRVANRTLNLVGDIAGFIFFYVMIRYGIQFTMMGLRRLSTSMNIPQAYFFACIPVSALFMFFFNLSIFAEDVIALKKAIKKEDDE